MMDSIHDDTRKRFRDIDGVVYCNVNDETLYRSVDNGTNWERIANKGEFSWKVDTTGRTHVVWPDKEKAAEYPTSFRKCEDCGSSPARPEFWPYCSEECRSADANYRESYSDANQEDDDDE